jgi:uncharacterized protein YbcI
MAKILLVFLMITMDKKLSIGQVKDSISKQVTKFYVDTIGHGPEETRIYIIEDMVIVRLKGKLLPIEEKLLEGEDGIGLVKDIRKKLHQILTTNLGLIVSNITRHKVISSHSDISTKTGEMLEVFILDSYYEKELNTNSDR